MSTPIYITTPGLRLPDAPSQPATATETADLLRQLIDVQKDQLALARHQAANQDQLTANVALTRDTKRGLFNPLSEAIYSSANLSPADTEWAIGTLANYQSLTYNNWTDCYGGAGLLSTKILNNPSVLHLITDNIYLGITFTTWGGSGGGFVYERTTAAAVPEPSPVILASAGLLLLAVSWRRLKCRRRAPVPGRSHVRESGG